MRAVTPRAADFMPQRFIARAETFRYRVPVANIADCRIYYHRSAAPLC